MASSAQRKGGRGAIVNPAVLRRLRQPRAGSVTYVYSKGVETVVTGRKVNARQRRS